VSGAALDIFLVALPGLEEALAEEAREAGFAGVGALPGGVRLSGDWPEVWRANLCLRGAGRVLLRIATFRALHLAQLDRRARRVVWGDVLRPDRPVRVEAACHASRIYHQKAAADRVARAIAETLGAPVSATEGLRVLVRIDDDLCTISIDTSGEPLHRRGHKLAVGKAPLRETLAALFLRQCGYGGTEPVLDPMCGSGTFPIEAAEIAAGLLPGRARAFAFEEMADFDAAALEAMRAPAPRETAQRFFGSDRDAGAVRAATANAERAGVAGLCRFACHAISGLARPEGPAGLVMVNPPYGARIGNKKLLYGLYGAMGQTLTARFQGWRVGLVTSEDGLARATGLPFAPPGPWVAHGGLTVRLWQTGPLG